MLKNLRGSVKPIQRMLEQQQLGLDILILGPVLFYPLPPCFSQLSQGCSRVSCGEKCLDKESKLLKSQKAEKETPSSIKKKKKKHH